MKIIKVASLSFLLTIVFILGFSNLANAEEVTSVSIGKNHIQELNLLLDDMTMELNEQLEKGSKSASVTKSFYGEPIELYFESNNGQSSVVKDTFYSNEIFQPMSSTRSNSASIGLNGGVTFKFYHLLNIDWSYNANTTSIISANANSVLTGAFYGKTDDTWSARQTDSVHNVYSTGRFRAFNIGVEYTTDFHVRVNGTGGYQIVRASVYR